MSETGVITESSPKQASFWKLFLIGTGTALLGNLVGWIISLFLLMVVAEDTVLEAYAWLTVLLSWNIIPLGCLIYGVLAGAEDRSARPNAAGPVSCQVGVWSWSGDLAGIRRADVGVGYFPALKTPNKLIGSPYLSNFSTTSRKSTLDVAPMS